jgi:hypothetical protein
VSAITDQLWEDYQAFVARDLSDVAVECLFCDAVFESLRRQGGKGPAGGVSGCLVAVASCVLGIITVRMIIGRQNNQTRL